MIESNVRPIIPTLDSDSVPELILPITSTVLSLILPSDIDKEPSSPISNESSEQSLLVPKKGLNTSRRAT
jgi:hypothetical protein